MDLPSTLNAPRMCALDNRIFWVRAMSLEGLGILLSWLDDVIPGRAGREGPPAINSDEGSTALTSPSGNALLVWIALRDQGVSWDECGALSDRATHEERFRLLDVLFAHRRTMQPSEGARDISETWCGKGMASMVQAIGYKEALSLSMDQFEWLMSDGEVDHHASPTTRGYLRAVEIYNGAQAARAAANGSAEGVA